jgi:hypothetical protein
MGSKCGRHVRVITARPAGTKQLCTWFSPDSEHRTRKAADAQRRLPGEPVVGVAVCCLTFAGSNAALRPARPHLQVEPLKAKGRQAGGVPRAARTAAGPGRVAEPLGWQRDGQVALAAAAQQVEAGRGQPGHQHLREMRREAPGIPAIQPADSQACTDSLSGSVC